MNDNKSRVETKKQIPDGNILKGSIPLFTTKKKQLKLENMTQGKFDRFCYYPWILSRREMHLLYKCYFFYQYKLRLKKFWIIRSYQQKNIKIN